MAKNVELIYGPYVIQALLDTAPERVYQIHALREANSAVIQAARALDIPVEFCQRAQLDKRTDGHHQGMMAEVAPSTPWDFARFKQALTDWSDQTIRLLALDQVQDPHNLGACMRSAAAYGVKGVVVPKNQSVALTPAVRKVSCGAAEIVPLIIVPNLGQAIKACQAVDMWTIGFDGQASTPLEDAALKRSLMLVMGAEGQGLRPQTQALCDELVAIPMPGFMESLNVSVATGIALYAADRAAK